MGLSRQIVAAVDRYWAEEVHILGIWEDEPAAICVVYRRTIDRMVTLGQKLEFRATSADGTIEGFARDVAINLAEPVGTAKARKDQHGIVWVAIPEGRPTPKPPVEVLQMLGGR